MIKKNKKSKQKLKNKFKLNKTLKKIKKMVVQLFIIWKKINLLKQKKHIMVNLFLHLFTFQMPIFI